MKGKKPDWNLCVKAEGDAKWRKVGVAWTSEKGNISIRLDRGARGPDWEREGVVLFPYREWEEKPRYESRRYARSAPGSYYAPTPTVPAVPELDYMEQQRAERTAKRAGCTPPPAAPPPLERTSLPEAPPNYEPDPEAEAEGPEWL